jgi:hypothetical protein
VTPDPEAQKEVPADGAGRLGVRRGHPRRAWRKAMVRSQASADAAAS